MKVITRTISVAMPDSVSDEDATKAFDELIRQNEFPDIGVHEVTWSDPVIEYVKDVGSSMLERPYAGPNKTNDDPEHVAGLVRNVNHYRLRRFASKLFRAVHAKTSNEFIGDEELATSVGNEARAILGYNRPLHENDAEYYALCDALVQRAWQLLLSAVEQHVE